jgi:hypothetical protein
VVFRGDRKNFALKHDQVLGTDLFKDGSGEKYARAVPRRGPETESPGWQIGRGRWWRRTGARFCPVNDCSAA